VATPKKRTSAHQTVATLSQEALRGAAVTMAAVRSTVKIDDLPALHQRLTRRPATPEEEISDLEEKMGQKASPNWGNGQIALSSCPSWRRASTAGPLSLRRVSDTKRIWRNMSGRKSLLLLHHERQHHGRHTSVSSGARTYRHQPVVIQANPCDSESKKHFRDHR
jgi:hypothetical protein